MTYWLIARYSGLSPIKAPGIFIIFFSKCVTALRKRAVLKSLISFLGSILVYLATHLIFPDIITGNDDRRASWPYRAYPAPCNPLNGKVIPPSPELKVIVSLEVFDELNGYYGVGICRFKGVNRIAIDYINPIHPKPYFNPLSSYSAKGYPLKVIR